MTVSGICARVRCAGVSHFCGNKCAPRSAEDEGGTASVSAGRSDGTFLNALPPCEQKPRGPLDIRATPASFCLRLHRLLSSYSLYRDRPPVNQTRQPHGEEAGQGRTRFFQLIALAAAGGVSVASVTTVCARPWKARQTACGWLEAVPRSDRSRRPSRRP